MMKSEIKVDSLSVQLQNREIGIINRLAGDRFLFSFNQDYIDDPHRPTLSLSFKGHTGDLVTSVRAYTSRLPPYFSNLLPEGHMRSYLAQRAGVKPEHEFFLLSALGADLPGALTIKPFKIENQIEESIENTKATQNSDRSVLRFSLAGIQLKFSAILESSGGLTIPTDGFGGSWIVKLPSSRFDLVPENEFVMLNLASKIGITVPQNKIIDIIDIDNLPKDASTLRGKVLAVERFDRTKNNKRIHMEDFAQVFGQYPEAKYERRSYANIAAVLWAEAGQTSAYDFLRRVVFSVLIGNADMHLKNWSVLYPDHRNPMLSPAYDLVATTAYLPNDNLALSFGGSRNLHEINAKQLRRFADIAHMPTNPLLEVVTETIERTVDAWKTLGHKELLPKDMIKNIDRQIMKVASNSNRNLR